jgi:hypothetical protein
VSNPKHRDSKGLNGINHLKNLLAVPGQYKFFPANAMMAAAAQFSPTSKPWTQGLSRHGVAREHEHNSSGLLGKPNHSDARRSNELRGLN